MINAVLQTIERNDLLLQGDSVIVALSGGADSVALLHVLNSIKEKYNLKIYAAHLNHMLRGEEADRDEKFCKILCENYSTELFVRHADIKKLARERKIGLELCGREERYKFFDELALNLGSKVATAHTASDNAETLIFRLVRGTSVRGAAGIPPRRGHFIRPLISCTRAEIESYCSENKLSFVTDSSNLSDDYARNIIRHKVIPVLSGLNPCFEQAALRYCESAAEVADFLGAQAESLLRGAKTKFGYNADTLLEADCAVQSEALAILCRNEADFSPEARHIALLRAVLKNGGAVDLGGCTAVCKQKTSSIVEKNQAENNLEISLNGDISFIYRDKLISAGVDNSKIELKPLVFRTRRGGDRFTYQKRNITKPLRKVFNEQKIPDELRDSLLLLCQDSTVLWCDEIGFSAQGQALTDSNAIKLKFH